jgi:hypothetical protein
MIRTEKQSSLWVLLIIFYSFQVCTHAELSFLLSFLFLSSNDVSSRQEYCIYNVCLFFSLNFSSCSAADGASPARSKLLQFHLYLMLFSSWIIFPIFLFLFKNYFFVPAFRIAGCSDSSISGKLKI